MLLKTFFFFAVVAAAAFRMAWEWWVPASRRRYCVDAIVPAYNEELCIAATVEALLSCGYIARVIVVNDGSTDGTRAVLDRLAAHYADVVAVHQANTGKGGALMAGVARASAPYVLLTDADTLIPGEGKGIGYLITDIERGADAVGGIPASNLNGAGLLPHIRATVKLPMIAFKRSFQQVFGGAPFLISGACGLFRTEVLRQVHFSDRTKVEDLDMTWTLVSQGYRVRQSTRCIVYSQECNSLKAEWLRWRRWIIGYAVCMRLHRKLLLSRFGLFSIFPMFLVVLVGLAAYASSHGPLLMDGRLADSALLFLPLLWLAVAFAIAGFSALHYRRFRIFLLAPAAVFYVVLAYAIWLIHGFRGLVTGREPKRDKPVRYAHVVG